MVATRRQKQAQKQQEQQVSKVLAGKQAASSHVSFGDDDDDQQPGPQSSTALKSGSNEAESVHEQDAASVDEDFQAALARQSNSDEENGHDDDDDDEPIEVVSNKSSRKQALQAASELKAKEKAERSKRQDAERKRAEQRRKEKAEAQAAAGTPNASAGPSRQPATESETLAAPAVEKVEEEEAANAAIRLDPSLFAEVFAKPVAAPRSILKKRSAEERADEVAKAKAEQRKRIKHQRRGGVVVGHDGLPVKRTEDGTLIRALETSRRQSLPLGQRKTNFDEASDDDDTSTPLDPVIRPSRLDPTVSLPNAKARAFKKRVLQSKTGLETKNKATAKAAEKSAKPLSKSNDDPLGLNDPAFLPGGEFYHIVQKEQKRNNKGSQGAGIPGAVAKQGHRGAGSRKDAVSVFRTHNRGGPALGFARSQM